MNQPLDQLQRLALLDSLIAHGESVVHQLFSPTAQRTLDKRETSAQWIAETQQGLLDLGATPKWFIWNERLPLSPLSFDQALQGLCVLRWRIVDGRSESIDGDSSSKLGVATLLVSFGDYVIDLATEDQSSLPIDVFLAFQPFQRYELDHALSVIRETSKHDAANGPAWEPSEKLIRAHRHAEKDILSIERGLRWRLGWALFTLGWQLLESIGDALTLDGVRCCSIQQAKASRIDFVDETKVPCPHCGMATGLDVTNEPNGEGGFTSVHWHCKACHLLGLFPVHPRPDSFWYQATRRDHHLADRWLPDTGSPKRSTTSQVVKILFLGSAPSDQLHMALGREVKEIDRQLRESDGGRQLALVQEWAVKPTDLQAILLRHRPQILHFSGHGDPSGRLVFEDSQGAACPAPVDALERLLALLGEGIRCVVLNACYSEAQAEAIRAQVPCVVGMNSAIPDSAAIAFASSFYLALGHGCSVKRAFDLGCVQIALAGAAESDIPILLCRPDTDPERVALVHMDT